MIFLFTTSNKPGARLIRWGLNTDVSHMAIMEELHPSPISVVLESRLSNGVDITWLKTFKEHNKVVTALRPKNLGLEEAKKLFEEIAYNIGGKDYDWKGVGYLAVAAVYFVKILGKEIQNTNPWADKKDFYCSEALFAVNEYLKGLGVNLNKYPRQMLTPDRAREVLIESGAFEDVTELF